jgi:hypothetical protein
VSLKFGVFELIWHQYGFDTWNCMDDMWQSEHDMAQWQANMWQYERQLGCTEAMWQGDWVVRMLMWQLTRQVIRLYGDDMASDYAC